MATRPGIVDDPLGVAGPNAGPFSAMVDPYLIWHVLTNFADFGGVGTNSFTWLIETSPNVTAGMFLGPRADGGPSGATLLRGFTVPAIFHPGGALANAHFMLATSTGDLSVPLSTLAHGKLDDLRRVELGAPGDLTQFPIPEAMFAAAAAPPADTYVGIIDDGIAYANDRFRFPDRTSRVYAYWEQHVDDGGIVSGPPPADLKDEDEFYRRDASQRPMRAVRHGTHVLDVATGAECRDAAGMPRIIAVQLPRRITEDTSGYRLWPYVLYGIRFMAGCLKGTDAPLVVNLSYGNSAGPHDGTSLAERTLDDLVATLGEERPIAVAIAAGNANLQRLHAELDIPPKQRRTLRWRVQPDTATSSYVEIWLPWMDEKAEQLVTISVNDPCGHRRIVRAGETAVFQHPDEDVPYGAVSFRRPGSYPVPESRGLANPIPLPILYWCERQMVLVSVAPTGGPDYPYGLAPSGVWTIDIDSGLDKALPIEAWIQRNDVPFGLKTGARQSNFDDPRYRRFDERGWPLDSDPNVHGANARPSYVRRRSTLNAYATGATPVVVGAVRRNDGVLSDYSSGGPVFPSPTGEWSRFVPDASTTGDDSMIHRGMLGSGTRSGSTAILNGTSVATGRMTRWLAQDIAGQAVPYDARLRVANRAVAMSADPVIFEREGAGTLQPDETAPGHRPRRPRIEM